MYSDSAPRPLCLTGLAGIVTAPLDGKGKKRRQRRMQLSQRRLHLISTASDPVFDVRTVADVASGILTARARAFLSVSLRAGGIINEVVGIWMNNSIVPMFEGDVIVNLSCSKRYRSRCFSIFL